jgi:hypothetical protein
MARPGAIAMSALILLTLLTGAVLGMRFKVLILVPAIGSALVIIVVGDLAGGSGLFHTLILAMLAATGLQMGYLCGALTRQTVLLARAESSRKFPLRSGAVRTD